jgi:SapC
MASAPPVNSGLPLLFNELTPLSSVEHASWKTRKADTAPFLTKQHAIPVTIDEFTAVQRHYPIIFSVGDNPVPLALMGLNEGVNTFVDEDGKLLDQVYVPAYIRRYPFLLARLREDAEELSLCFDPSADAIGPYDEGEDLFADGKPTEVTQAILNFCEQFEQAGQRTTLFMKELVDSGLLMDGEVSIQMVETDNPFIYRGFQMVNEEKLRDLRGDTLRKMMKSGLLPLVHAHLFSLQTMREIFGRQVAQNKMPQPALTV